MITLQSDADERAAQAMAAHVAFLLATRFGMDIATSDKVFDAAMERLTEAVDTGLSVGTVMHLSIVEYTLEQVFDRQDAPQMMADYKKLLMEHPETSRSGQDLVQNMDPFDIALGLMGHDYSDSDPKIAAWEDKYQEVRRVWLSPWTR